MKDPASSRTSTCSSGSGRPARTIASRARVSWGEPAPTRTSSIAVRSFRTPCSGSGPDECAPEVVDRRAAPWLGHDRVAEHDELVDRQHRAAVDPQRCGSARGHAPPLDDVRSVGRDPVSDHTRATRLGGRDRTRDVHRRAVVDRDGQPPEHGGGDVADELSGQQDRPEGSDPLDGVGWAIAGPPDRPGGPDEVAPTESLSGDSCAVRGVHVERAVAERGRKRAWSHAVMLAPRAPAPPPNGSTRAELAPRLPCGGVTTRRS